MEETRLFIEVYASELPNAAFVREVLSRGLSYVQSFRWPTEATELPFSDGDFLIHQKLSDSEDAVIQIDGCLARVEISHGFVEGHVAGDRERVNAVIGRLQLAIPRFERGDEFEVPITFWRSGPRGPASSRRKIAASPWKAIAENYAVSTRHPLESLIERFRPVGSGRLLLWHGEPGTGKTNALRSLAWEWRSWCRVEYVVDPEKLLGESDYLMRVLLEDHEDHNFLEHHDKGKSEPRWRLLALEDAGELVASDAREQVGQRLSRLLNTVDGLLGEGLRLLVLITTNEQLSSLHPAVDRFGRCAAEIEFTKFSSGEARDWLRSKDVDQPVISAKTLADLYAMLEGEGIRSRKTSEAGLYL